jgi:anti-anti-sigma regulatory factor
LGGIVVLKITVKETGELTEFKLEGKLSGPWVSELNRVWLESGARLVAVDICGVTYVDSEGEQLLARMYKHGVKLHAAGCMNRSIVERIKHMHAMHEAGVRPAGQDE